MLQKIKSRTADEEKIPADELSEEIQGQEDGLRLFKKAFLQVKDGKTVYTMAGDVRISNSINQTLNCYCLLYLEAGYNGYSRLAP